MFSSSLAKGTWDVYEEIGPTVASQPHKWDAWELVTVPTAAATNRMGTEGRQSAESVQLWKSEKNKSINNIEVPGIGHLGALEESRCSL